MISTASTPIDLDDRTLVSSYLRVYPPEISEHTFTNLYIWRQSRPIRIVEYKKSLVLLAATEDPEKFLLFGPPVGPVPITEVVADMGDAFAGAIRVPAGIMAELSRAGLQPLPDWAHADYVYRVADLAGLAGRRYAKKRNQVKQCLGKHHCVYEPLTQPLVSVCLAMQDEWCAARECEHTPGLCQEYGAIVEMLNRFESLGLSGGVILVEGAVRAFAVAERLSSDTAAWHVEKAMSGIPGLGQLINHWFAKYGLNDFTYVNREQDLGIGGLRQAKESYHPHHLVEKYATLLPEPGPHPGRPARELCPD